MKKLGIGIFVLMFIVLVAMPVLALNELVDIDDSTLCYPDFWTWVDDRDDHSVDKDLFDDKDMVDFDVKFCGLGQGLGGQSVNGVMFMEKNYERSDVINGGSYANAHGIVTTQMSSGNSNLQSAAIYADVKYLGDIDLVPVGQSVNGVLFLEKGYMRYDMIGGGAFANAVGIITTQLSSGNANLQQAIVDIEVNPSVFCHPAPAPICPCDPCGQ